jgi:hypothetical protein
MSAESKQKNQLHRKKNEVCGTTQFNTGYSDPFLWACVVHDRWYDKARQPDGTYNEDILRMGDQIFWLIIEQKSRGSFALRIRAYIYFSIVTAWRKMRIGLQAVRNLVQ